MEWIVLLPPFIAISLALWTRRVYLSLLAGLWVGTIILAGGNPVRGLAELAAQMVAVFEDAGNTRIIFFCLLVGGLIALMQTSGGVHGFVAWAQRRGWGASRKGAELLAWAVGMVVFVESNITSLTVGAVSRPLFDKLKLPREKLAYYCDATSAPVCMAIPLNGWGAYVLGLLAVQGVSEGEAASLLAQSLLFNFFSMGAIAFALALAWTGWSFGPMKRAEARAAQTGALSRPGSKPLVADELAGIEPGPNAPRRARDLIIPLCVMVGMIFAGLYATGEGNIMEGSGSTAVLWAVGAAVLVAMALYALPRGGRPGMPVGDAMDQVMKGSSGMIGVTFLVVLAFALGRVAREMEMGPYVAGLLDAVGPLWWMPAAVFLIGAFVSFALGSSWTAFALLIPIALPLTEGGDLSAPLMLGAVLSGGVFGDYASPLSDTSIISSMSSACDHIDHVRSQMPYALVVAGVALLAYVAAGLATT